MKTKLINVKEETKTDKYYRRKQNYLDVTKNYRDRCLRGRKIMIEIKEENKLCLTFQKEKKKKHFDKRENTLK